MRERLKSLLAVVRGLQPRARTALIGVSLLLAAVIVATCGACRHTTGKTDPSVGPAAPRGTSSAEVRAAAGDAGVLDPLMWSHARTGNPESLQTLAIHEGASGLVDAAESDATLRPIALRAMAYADGWAQMPYLAKIAATGDDDDAALALDSAIELAARPRTSVDVEDADELADGCRGLLAIAKDVGKAKSRRIGAIRALRMMPCPKPAEGEGDVPTDLDAK